MNLDGRVIDVDHMAKMIQIGNVTTPAMSLVKDNELKIFSSFHKLESGEFLSVSKEQITHLPHILPQYSDVVAKKVVDEVAENIIGGSVIAISFYKDPRIYEKVLGSKPSMIIIRDMPSRFSLRAVIEFFSYMREKSGPETLLLLSSYVHWKFIPFLVYLGVDVIDVGPQELKLFKSGVNGLVGYGTPFLLGLDEGYLTEKDYEHLIKLNRRILDDLFIKMRRSISKGKLRDLVEVFSHIDQETDAMLAYLDNQYLEFFKTRVPLGKPKTNIFVGLESFRRPLVAWYFNRFKERYIPPKTPKILVLFPCAARKPYSFSKSHKIFKDALAQGAGMYLYLVHEVMLTSPIGVVPRELEFSYPNAHYDTTTTGNWSIGEVEHVSSMLEIFLRKKLGLDDEFKILVHLEGGYLESAMKALDRMGLEYEVTTEGKHPTDPEALSRLSRSLSELVNKADRVDLDARRLRLTEDALSILSYQFGREFVNAVKDDAEAEGSLYSKKGFYLKDYAVFDKREGLFIPLKKAVVILNEIKRYMAVVVSESVRVGGSIKASHVLEVDESVHSGEIIGLLNEDGEPLGVGKLLIAGKDVKKSKETDVINVVKLF